MQSKAYVFVATVEKNTEVRRELVCRRLELMVTIKNYEQARVWLCLGSWHNSCIYSMLNYMSDQLQNQRYLQVNLQMKLMDMLSLHGIATQYSSFVTSVISHGDLMRRKRLAAAVSLCRALDLARQQAVRKRHAISLLVRWRTRVCSADGLARKLDRKLQLARVVSRISPRVKAQVADSFEAITQEAAIRRNRVNLINTLVQVHCCCDKKLGRVLSGPQYRPD